MSAARRTAWGCRNRRPWQRCRPLFDDPLPERGRGTMRLTAKAQALRDPLKSALEAVGQLIRPPDMPLERIRATLRIAMADYPATLLTVGLQAGLARTAPGVDLVIQPWHGGRAARAALIEGRSDMVLSVLPQDDPDIRRTDILHDHHVVAMRRGMASTSGAGWTGRMSSSRAGARRAVRWTGSWPTGASAAGWGW